jgi:hypothetical protein
MRPPPPPLPACQAIVLGTRMRRQPHQPRVLRRFLWNNQHGIDKAVQEDDSPKTGNYFFPVRLTKVVT